MKSATTRLAAFGSLVREGDPWFLLVRTVEQQSSKQDN